VWPGVCMAFILIFPTTIISPSSTCLNLNSVFAWGPKTISAPVFSANSTCPETKSA